MTVKIELLLNADDYRVLETMAKRASETPEEYVRGKIMQDVEECRRIEDQQAFLESLMKTLRGTYGKRS